MFAQKRKEKKTSSIIITVEAWYSYDIIEFRLILIRVIFNLLIIILISWREVFQ